MNRKYFIFRLFYVAAAAILTFISLKTVFALIGPEPDSLLSITLWQGVKAGGWNWIRHFKYTPDNWLLSIIPFNFLAFALFGAKPGLVIFSGWLVFFASACVSGAIAWSLNARRAAFCIPLVLLSLGSFALSSGDAAYPASHDVTNLYGLMALLCYIRGLNSQHNLYIVLLGVFLVAGSISDPWMVVAYDIPFLLISGFRAYWRPHAGLQLYTKKLFYAVLFANLLIHTHMFWLFGFIPSQPTRLAHATLIVSNLSYLVRDLGGMLNLLPWERSNRLVPALVSLGLCGLVVLNGTLVACRLLGRQAGVTTILALAGLSVSATFAGVIFINVAAADFSCRFILNAVYLLTIMLASTADLTWDQLGKSSKRALGAFAALFMVSGLASTASIWSKPGFTCQDNRTGSLIAFLSANNLHYGYGPYWGSLANAVTAETGGKFTVRPITFNKTNGMVSREARAQSSPGWHLSQDIPASQKDFFILIASDGEECSNLTLCLQGVAAQFGPPVRILRYGAAYIYVWDHPLLGYPYDVSGEYWDSNNWGWMGSSMIIHSRQPMQITLQGVGEGGPVTRAGITINGQYSEFRLKKGDAQTVSIPAQSLATITARPMVPNTIFTLLLMRMRPHKMLRIHLPQPAP